MPAVACLSSSFRTGSANNASFLNLSDSEGVMAMSMQELFYGQSEPAYFAHCSSYSPAHLSESRVRGVEQVSIDLMVPMCCARCEDEVRDALYASRGVCDVVCDSRYQRVTVIGYVDPAQALRQVRRVNNGAMFWSDTSPRYEVSAYRKSRRAQRVNSSNAQRDRPSGDAYSRSFCPAYRDGAKTYYWSLPPTETVEVRDY